MRSLWKLLFIVLVVSLPLFSTGCGASYMDESQATVVEEEDDAEAEMIEEEEDTGSEDDE